MHKHEAERAVEIGKNEANESRLVLAKAFIAQGKRVEATAALHALLEKNPPEDLAGPARRLLDGLARNQPRKRNVIVSISRFTPLRLRRRLAFYSLCFRLLP